MSLLLSVSSFAMATPSTSPVLTGNAVTVMAAPAAANAPAVRSAPRKRPLLQFGRDQLRKLRLPTAVPYWRLGLSSVCVLAAVSQDDTYEQLGWVTLGGGLLTWALMDWFVPKLRSAAWD